jgi:hypothetical protein
VWIAALVFTMSSGFATLLTIDDLEANGSTMILFLSRLAVEGMLYCSWVSTCKKRMLIFRLGGLVLLIHLLTMRCLFFLRGAGMLGDVTNALVG